MRRWHRYPLTASALAMPPPPARADASLLLFAEEVAVPESVAAAPALLLFFAVALPDAPVSAVTLDRLPFFAIAVAVAPPSAVPPAELFPDALALAVPVEGTSASQTLPPPALETSPEDDLHATAPASAVSANISADVSPRSAKLLRAELHRWIIIPPPRNRDHLEPRPRNEAMPCSRSSPQLAAWKK